MKKYTAIIIDDEPKLQKVLKLKLEKYSPQIQVIGCVHNAKAGYSLITQKKPDILFLDIAMPEETGFDLLDYFDTFSFETIFVTGFSEYLYAPNCWYKQCKERLNALKSEQTLSVIKY